MRRECVPISCTWTMTKKSANVHVNVSVVSLQKRDSSGLFLFTTPSAGEELPSEIEGRSNCFFALTPSREKGRDAQSKGRRLAFASFRSIL